MRAAHSEMFECPVCDYLFKTNDSDLECHPEDEYITIPLRAKRWVVVCRKCKAQSNPHEGYKSYSF